MTTENVLITGTSGFIRFHVVQRLFSEGKKVLGLDNMNAYYDVNLMYARLPKLVK
jgi:UDP-glucuronate 4-epimerase